MLKISNRNFSPKLKFGIVAVLIVIFFLILNLTIFSKEIRNVFYFISSPIQKTLWRAGDRISDFFETIKEIGNLKKENEEIKFKNQKLSAEIALLRELKRENKILREALEIGLQEEFELIFAQIIGKDPFEDIILINKGLNQGLLKDMPVITQEKILLGRIKEVYRNFSKIILISHKESFFNAEIQGREIIGILRGKGNFRIFLDMIPVNEEISQGDFITASALGGIFPKGLLIGQIIETRRDVLQPFQQAEVNPDFDIEEIDAVFIIKNF